MVLISSGLKVLCPLSLLDRVARRMLSLFASWVGPIPCRAISARISLAMPADRLVYRCRFVVMVLYCTQFGTPVKLFPGAYLFRYC